ncbi:MAG: DUF559 domain-containing protein [Myxococcales bacterium]
MLSPFRPAGPGRTDGPYHAARTGADASRDVKLARLGWRVVRFSAQEVLGDLRHVVGIIRASLNGL